MNINRKIEEALSELVHGNIWPLSCPLEELPGEYIVYNPEADLPEDFGDDQPNAWIQYMQIHWFGRTSSGKPVNYVGKRMQIRNALYKAGFALSGIETFFESDTGYTHLCFLVNMIEDN